MTVFNIEELLRHGYEAHELTDGSHLLIPTAAQLPPPPPDQDGYVIEHIKGGVYLMTEPVADEPAPVSDDHAKLHVEGTDGLDV